MDEAVLIDPIVLSVDGDSDSGFLLVMWIGFRDPFRDSAVWVSAVRDSVDRDNVVDSEFWIVVSDRFVFPNCFELRLHQS